MSGSGTSSTAAPNDRLDRAAADADRISRRYPTRRVPRAVTVLAVALLATLFCGWLVWAGLRVATPPVKGQLLAWEVVSDTEVTFVLTVDRRDPSVPVTCRVIAQATDFERVGSLDVAVPAHEARLVDVDGSLRTFRQATSASVDSCWTD